MPGTHLSSIQAEKHNQTAWYAALTLRERWETDRPQSFEQETDPELLADAHFRLEKWKGLAPFRRPALFAERLEFDQLSEEQLSQLLQEPLPALRRRLGGPPDWLKELEEVLKEEDGEVCACLRAYGLTGDELKPFEALFQRSFLALLQPLILHGVRRFQAGLEQLGQASPLFTSAGAHALSIWLQNLPLRLYPLVSRVLTLELHVARLEKRLHGETSEERFQDFVRQLHLPDVRRRLLEEYAPLARLAWYAVEHWVTYGLEFFQHLQEDWPRLLALLELKAEPGLLTEARCGMGDQHRQGRSTILVSFSSGLRLVYKPRSLSIDQHFQHLLTWINQQGWQPRLRVLRLLDCGEHGWSEFVEALPCRSQAEVERFYLRQGAYLALLYTLNAVDFHYENLIAAGEDPMLIDLESLLHPQIGEKREKNAQTRLLEQMESSVLRVGMLPIRLWAGENSDGIDLSGLGGEGGQIVPRPVLQPINPGTDEMRFVRKNGEMPAQQNRPHLEGSPIDFLAYRPQLLQGFREMYRLLMQRKDALLAGPLQLFAEDSTRIIIRPTNTYAVLLHEGTHPNLLRNMLDRDSFFDQLWLSIGTRPELKRVIAAEQADLHNGDIPIFTSRPATRDIFTSRGERIPDFCAAPALEQVTSCLAGLNELDLERQLWFIEATLASARLQQQNQAQATRSSLGEPARTDVTPEDLLRQARLIGDRLAALAFRDGQRAQWLALTMVNERTWEIQPAGPNLYGGVAGIALFLAYLGVMSGDERYRQLAEEAVRTLQSQIEGNPETFKDVGAFSGWGGIIYLYTHLGVLWQDQNWFTRAEEAIQRSVSLLQEDTMLDIMAGAAGYIMALLALDQVWPSPLALKTARQAGDYLVTALQQARAGEKPSFGLAATRPLTGLSHGSAGLALSLMSLAARENNARYRAAAQEVLAYERSVYVPERQNWPDFRILDTALSAAKEQRAADADGQQFMTTWCHGAAGIGLARLASLPYQDDEITRAEIAIAVQTTLRDGFGWCHSLCHGDLGNLDLLLVARTRLAEVCEHAQLQHLLARILAGIEQSGYITGAPMGLEVPSLMVGLAGMGYAFLRASDPTRVPSVLLLEPPVRQPFQKPVEQSGGYA